MARAYAPGSLLFYFCQLIPRVGLLVFLLVSAAIDEENYFTFRWLWQWSSIGQGHHPALPRSFWLAGQPKTVIASQQVARMRAR